jgi:hypothetical protein
MAHGIVSPKHQLVYPEVAVKDRLITLATAILVFGELRWVACG